MSSFRLQWVPPFRLWWWSGGLVLLLSTTRSWAAQEVEPLLEQGRAFYAARNLDAAETVFRQLVAREPRSGAVAYYLGKVAVLREDYAVAAQWLEKAVALAPTETDYHLWLGNSYAWAAAVAPLYDKTALGRKCLAAYRRAVELDPDNVAARMGLVNFYRHVPRLLGGGLERAYAEAAQIRRRDADLGLLALAIIHRHEKKYAQSYAELTALLGKNHKDYTAHYEFGRLASASGQWHDEGQRRLRWCLTQVPSENDASHDLVWWHLGQLAEQGQDNRAARQAYEVCLRLNPRSQPATEALARLR